MNYVNFPSRSRTRAHTRIHANTGASHRILSSQTLKLSPSRLVGRWLARSPGTTEIRKSLKISNIKYSNNGKEAKNEPKGDPGYTNFHRPCVYLNHIKRLAVHSEKIILIMPNS